MNNFEAAHVGSVHQLKTLMEQGNNFDELTPNGWSPLHFAIAFNKTDNVIFLLENDVDPDIGMTHHYGITPLMLAASLGKIDYLRILVQHGANVGYTNRHGKSALTNAVLSDDNQCVHFLVENGANANGTLLYLLTTGQQYKYVRMFAKTIPDKSYFFYMAAVMGNVTAVRIFLELGADVNTVYYNMPIIHHIVDIIRNMGDDEGEFSEIADILILYGAKTEDLLGVFSVELLEHTFSEIISRPDFTLEMWESVPRSDSIFPAFETVLARNRGEAKLLFEHLSEDVQKQIRTTLMCVNRTYFPLDLYDKLFINMSQITA